MSLNDFLLELLEDPLDHGALWYAPSAQVLYNPRRRRAYAVRGSIPVMLDAEARDVDDAEAEALLGDPTGRWTGATSAS